MGAYNGRDSGPVLPAIYQIRTGDFGGKGRLAANELMSAYGDL